MGKRDKPFYRIVIADESEKRDGKCIETIGQFEPGKKVHLVINREKLDYWQKVGAQPTDAVRKLLDTAKTV